MRVNMPTDDLNSIANSALDPVDFPRGMVDYMRRRENDIVVDEELAFAPATEHLRLIADRHVSPVELTQLYLDRIDRLDPQLHSYLTVTRDEAMRAARSAEDAVVRGDSLGPLHGLPVSIKETQTMEGTLATAGSVVFKDRVAPRDSAVVERLRNAGAVILGKTNLSEFAMVGTCENTVGEKGRNPWNPECTPGGSSGGAAAAVAAGLCSAAAGSDGGGSIRIPANFCGVYGIKPTLGRVSGYTGLGGPPALNMFSQNGPLTRTVRDAAVLLQTLAGFDRRDVNSLRQEPPDFIAAVDGDIAGLRIAWSPDFGFAQVDSEVLEVTSEAARAFVELSCRVEEVDLELAPPYDTYGPILDANSHADLGQYLASHGEQLTGFARFMLERGPGTTAAYAQALGQIALQKARMADLFEEYDLLLSPTACFPAFPYGEFPGEPCSGKSAYPEQYWNGAFTMPINVSGHAAATVPAGFSGDGLPIGLHIVGGKGGEQIVLAASAAFEQTRPWVLNRPEVS